MRSARNIIAPLGIVCGLAIGLIAGSCGQSNYARPPDGSTGSGTGGSGDGTGGGPDGTGGVGDGTGGAGAGPVATGGSGTATGGTGPMGSGGGSATGGRAATGGGTATGGATATGGTTATGGGGTGTATGGGTAATGGRGTGGVSGTGTGGAATGGAAVGTGGAATGGAATGGAATGGAATGGAATGGAATGGAATGGASTGGAPAPSGAVLYYPFDEAAGAATTAADASGNARNGTVTGGGTFATGMVRNGLTFAGGTTTATSTYVTVPVGFLTSTRDMTISLWVKVTTDKMWQRIFDFGKTNTTGYMFLTTHAATVNVMRFAITQTNANAEQRLDGPALPVGTWKHIALVFGTGGVSLYVDGVKFGSTNTAVTLRPMDVGAFTNQWLGRSAYDDPYFAGQLDELRIYNRALSDAEITVLFGLR